MKDVLFIGSEICFYDSLDVLNKPGSVPEYIREQCKNCALLFGIGFAVSECYVQRGTIVRVLDYVYDTYYIIRFESKLFLVKESHTHLIGYAPGTMLDSNFDTKFMYGYFAAFFDRGQIDSLDVNIPSCLSTGIVSNEHNHLYIIWSGYGYDNENDQILIVYQPTTAYLFAIQVHGVKNPTYQSIKNNKLIKFPVYANYANRFLQSSSNENFDQLHLFEWCSNEHGEMLIRLDKIQCIKINDLTDPRISDQTLDITMVSGTTLKNVISPNHNVVDRWIKLLGETRVVKVAEYWFDMYRVQIISRLSETDNTIMPCVYVSITLVSGVAIKLVSSLEWYDAIKVEWQTTITNIYNKD